MLSIALVGTIGCTCRGEMSETELVFREFKSQTIKIPDQLHPIILEYSHVDMPEKNRAPYTMIYYYDQESCNSCVILHNERFLPIKNISKENGVFSIKIILVPKKEEMVELLSLAKTCELYVPTIIDSEGDFEKENHIPPDKRFHVFLIDEAGHPVFIGDPMSSPELMRIFKRVIRRLS